jgi:hypothetical protein
MTLLIGNRPPAAESPQAHGGEGADALATVIIIQQRAVIARPSLGGSR